MIPCPRCGGQNTRASSRQSNKRPTVYRGAVIRFHKCADCGREFRSYQVVPVTRAAVEAIEEALDGEAVLVS